MAFPAARGIRPVKSFKNAALFLFRDTNAVIRHLNTKGFSVISKGKPDESLGRCIADGVVQQDRKHLPDASGITAAGRKRFLRKLNGKPDRLLGGYWFKGFKGFQQKRIQLCGAHFHRPGMSLHAGEQEHIVNQPRHTHPFRLNGIQKMSPFLLVPTPGSRGAGKNHGQRRAELMGGRGNKLGLAPLAFLQRPKKLPGEIPCEQKQSSGSQCGEKRKENPLGTYLLFQCSERH
ncbi:hypothetical protein IMSAGC007_01809 [Lachnospiraceae bacterium]|nr:hypothetical protein IMSAGC007_01809 [Lachnospiraceae bacterium]